MRYLTIFFERSQYMKKIAYYLLCLTLLFSYIQPSIFNDDVKAEKQGDYIVKADALNMRKGPGLTYPVIKYLKKNDQLTFIEKSGDWFKVSYNGTEGWVASWLVQANASKASAKKVVSHVDNLNVRSEPSLNGAVLGKLYTGNEATYVSKNNEWIQIQTKNLSGWVHSKYVSVKNVEKSSSTSKNNEALPAGNYFTVNVSAVNVRKKPDLNAKRIGVIYLNEQYEVLDRSGNWIQIKYGKEKGWVYGFYGTYSNQKTSASSQTKVNSNKQTTQSNEKVIIQYDGTNLRVQPNTNSKVGKRAKIGETYSVISKNNDWYEINVDDQKLFVASWVVKTSSQSSSTSQSTVNKADRKAGTLRGLTIVIDPGHGGNDHGTTGVTGTPEKSVNLKTAELLASKLRSAGANVIMTRESDKYVDLRKRVSISNQYNADAFISIHYDATVDHSVNGFTTYYFNGNNKQLANAIHKGLKGSVQLRDRGVQVGNYLVLRENSKPAVLLELGYLSNRDEERTVNSKYYREAATQGIYNGLINYFDSLLR